MNNDDIDLHSFSITSTWRTADEIKPEPKRKYSDHEYTVILPILNPEVEGASIFPLTDSVLFSGREYVEPKPRNLSKFYDEVPTSSQLILNMIFEKRFHLDSWRRKYQFLMDAQIAQAHNEDVHDEIKKKCSNAMEWLIQQNHIRLGACDPQYVNDKILKEYTRCLEYVEDVDMPKRMKPLKKRQKCVIPNHLTLEELQTICGPDIEIIKKCLSYASGAGLLSKMKLDPIQVLAKKHIKSSNTNIPSLAFLAALVWSRGAATNDFYSPKKNMPPKLKTYLRMLMPEESDLIVTVSGREVFVIKICWIKKEINKGILHWEIVFNDTSTYNLEKITWVIKSVGWKNHMEIRRIIHTPANRTVQERNIEVSFASGLHNFGKCPSMLFRSKLSDYKHRMWVSPRPRDLRNFHDKIPAFAQIMLNITWALRHADVDYREVDTMIHNVGTNIPWLNDKYEQMIRQRVNAILWLIKWQHIILTPYGPKHEYNYVEYVKTMKENYVFTSIDIFMFKNIVHKLRWATDDMRILIKKHILNDALQKVVLSKLFPEYNISILSVLLEVSIEIECLLPLEEGDHFCLERRNIDVKLIL